MIALAMTVSICGCSGTGPAETAQAGESIGVMVSQDGKNNSISLMTNKGEDGVPVDDLAVGEVHIPVRSSE